MASLVAPLACGFAAAPSGTAEFYNEGTATLATVYSDPHGVTQETTHTLDQYGGLSRYVERRVDVVVKTAAGATVRTFTWGTDAREARVENLGFSGTDANGSTVAGGRTTVDAVLTSLYASLGGPDGLTLLSGVPTTIHAALSASTASILYSVKASAYGASGNDTNDDTNPIQAAINAAALAGGGLVWFPHGTYKITGSLSIPTGSKVALLGESESGVTIKQYTSGINGWLLFGADSTSIQGISFARNATALSGRILATSGGRISVIGCTFAGYGGTQLYADTSANSEFNCYGCKFGQDEAGSRIGLAGVGGARFRFIACQLNVSLASAICFENAGQFDLTGTTVTMTAAGATLFSTSATARVSGGRIDASGVTSGTTILSAGASLTIAGTQLEIGAGGTLQMASTGALNESATTPTGSGTINVGAPTAGYSTSRNVHFTATSGALTNYTANAAFGIHEITTSTSGTFTMNAPTGPTLSGWPLTFILRNTSGANVTMSWNAAFLAATPATVVPSGGCYSWRFMKGSGTITSDWIQEYSTLGWLAAGSAWATT